MVSHTFRTIIGRAESIDFRDDPECVGIPAKIDTGAYSSSVWASNITERNGELEFELMGKGHPAYTGKKLKTKAYKMVTIQNSFGQSEVRFGVNLKVSFCGKRVTTFFTLSERSMKIYPVLIGRKMLKGRFLVDVSTGHPVASEETEENLGYPALKNKLLKR